VVLFINFIILETDPPELILSMCFPRIDLAREEVFIGVKVCRGAVETENRLGVCRQGEGVCMKGSEEGA
jgi:hypothetical protein